MIVDHQTRLLIIGNSGSGKSTLATHVSAATGLPMHDLDLIHWHEDGRKRDEAEALMLVDQIASVDSWIIEGVYGWLAAAAVSRATALIWIDLSPSECRDGLLQRGLRRAMTVADQNELLARAAAYWSRQTSSSFDGHQQLYETFDGAKHRVTTRESVSMLLARAPGEGELQIA
jgi:adenylate kinase family enzyme